MASSKVAALYVETNGIYFNRPDVDPWDVTRNAQLYEGPHPVVAHPPCQRWGRYWGGGPMLHGTPRQKKLGDDGGCFEAAFAAVNRWGGVLEHPEASHAWTHFNIARPPRRGDWVRGNAIGWTCCVEQGHYGHLARKATWLYFVGAAAPYDAVWGPSIGRRLDEGFHSIAERAAKRAAGAAPRPRLSKAANIATPRAFAEFLIFLAKSAVA